MRRDVATAILAVFCAVMVAGALLTDWADHTGLTADVDVGEDGGVRVELTGTLPSGYGWMLYSGGSEHSHVYLYLDAEYGSPVSLSMQEDLMDSMKRYLESRGVSCAYVDAAGLPEAMSDLGCVVVMASGALPDTVYGTGEDTAVERWLSEGVTLYWMNGILGELRSVPGGTENTGRELLGAGSQLSPKGDTFAYIPSEWSVALRYANTDASYGVLADLPGSTVLGLVTDDGHSSCSAVPFGTGCVVVIGGMMADLELGQTSLGYNLAIADAIAMGLSCGSELLDSGTGSKGYGSASFVLTPPDGADSLYIWAGDYNSEWGIRFAL